MKTNFLDFIGLGTFYECIKQYYASKDEVKNTFKKITVGDKTITGGNSNNLTIEAGNNIMITPDTTNNKMTISSVSNPTGYTFIVKDDGHLYIQYQSIPEDYSFTIKDDGHLYLRF